VLRLHTGSLNRPTGVLSPGTGSLLIPLKILMSEWRLRAYSVEKLLAHKFREIFTITMAHTVSFFEVCCAKNNFGLPYVPKIFYFQDVGLEHGVFQHNLPIPDLHIR
jgi:hypothetical protein